MAKKAFKGHVPGKVAEKRDEFPCGKKRAKPVEPNARVMAAREALGLNDKSTIGPVAFAYGEGWLTRQDVVMADVYASAYRHAGLHSPSMSSTRDQSFATGAAAHLSREWEDLTDEDVKKLSFGNREHFSRYEINKIWDSAFRPTGGEGASSSAMKRWKAFATAMTPAERDEVDRVVLYDLYPQWILDRRRGQADTRSEARRALLISGLRKIGQTVVVLRRRQAANDHHGNDNEAV